MWRDGSALRHFFYRRHRVMFTAIGDKQMIVVEA
jgi:hypothetical protein